jgi:alkylation response protein AidB-like acyl-CoA dehydrogenase
MTEKKVASSDATNIESQIKKDASESEYYVLNGHKWWISGACDPRCAFAIFMGKTDVSADMHRQQSMIIVPMPHEGIKSIKPLPVFGFMDAPHGHAEMVFSNVRVPSENIILGPGRGFEIAQARLGVGRLHHCMRLIGMGNRALQLCLERVKSRHSFGKRYDEHQTIRFDIAQSRIELDAARLVVLDAAKSLDEMGNKAARGKVSAAKLLAPRTVLSIVDRVIQIFGGAGVSDEFPLASIWAAARTLRIADGPDAVHFETIAKIELRKAKL